MRCRKSAPWLLLARLAKMGLELGSIGHREGRAVNMKYAMSEPTCRIERFLVQLSDTPLKQRDEHFEFDPHPGFAISGRGERYSGQVRQMLARRIAVQDLQKENLNCDDRIEG